LSDENLKKFLKTWDGTGDIAKEYNKYLEHAFTSTSEFSTSLKNVAADMSYVHNVSHRFVNNYNFLQRLNF